MSILIKNLMTTLILNVLNLTAMILAVTLKKEPKIERIMGMVHPSEKLMSSDIVTKKLLIKVTNDFMAKLNQVFQKPKRIIHTEQELLATLMKTELLLNIQVNQLEEVQTSQGL